MTAKFVQHRSPQASKARARAPYNFVPLPERVLPAEEFNAHDRYDPNRHTGYIDLEITTETPLYTRCATPIEVWSKYRDDEYFEGDRPKVAAVRECQDFFHHGNVDIPVIPGSTLRGMTRALVEILAYGKMNFVTDERIIHRAVADTSSLGKKYRDQMLGKTKDYPRIWLDYPSPNLRGGYLDIIDGEWFICPAITHSGETFVHVSSESSRIAFGRDLPRHKTYPCWVVPRERRTREKSEKFKLDMATTGQISFEQVEDETKGWRKARLVVSGYMNNKKMECAIYERDIKAKLIDIKREDRLLYQEDLRLSREKKNTPRELKQGEPVFYLLNDKNELIFFGSTMMFRLPYPNTVSQLIPESLGFFNEIDLAESIFGVVQSPNKKKRFDGKQLAGRVFFSAAICQTPNPFYQNDKQGRFVPDILSSPKPTSFQLYLSQPEPNHYEPRDAQNGYDDLKAKWYVVTEKAIDKMKADDVPTNVTDKVRRLLGREFAIDDNSKADDKFVQALESNGITKQELRLYQRRILTYSAHELRTYYDDYKSEYGTVIRGSKRYWHKRNITESDFQSKNARIRNDNKGVEENRNGQWQNSKQHTIIRPVKPKTKFRGRVCFENLSCLELGALLTALELPPEKRHQIGMAKPYGLGSVEIKPTLVLQDRINRYQSLFDEQSDAWNNDKKHTDEIEQIKTEATSAFQETVLNHYNDLVTQDSKVSQFWKIPRLQALATMLEWQDAGSFQEKQYQDLTSPQWRNRYVLPYPQAVENQANEPKQIQLINPNLWAESCSDDLSEQNENENKVVEDKNYNVAQQTPTVPLALSNLLPNRVASELHRYYQDWLKVTDETLKIEMAKVIVDKGKHWGNAKKRDWFKEVVEFAEKDK